MAPTSKSAPSTWSSSPSSAPPSARRCSTSKTRRSACSPSARSRARAARRSSRRTALLSEAPGNRFAGNVEGRDLPAAKTDVVVTDGFTGNVSLKLLEGTAKTVAAAVGDAARSNPIAAAGGLLLKPALNGLRRELHPDTTGGAILLGLRGIAVVGHGSSGAEGIANAIRLAARCAEVDAVGRTAALLAEGGAGRGALAAGGDA